MTDLVIGTGPSGVSVATALLARGRRVLMLDGGKVPEPNSVTRREEMAGTPPENWTEAQKADWQAPQFATPPGQVRRFGSDFAMEPARATLSAADDIGLRASMAEGGLSNLWGSAVLPNRAQDIFDWPIGPDELSPHYKAVADFMPVSGRSDDLENVLPAFSMQGRTALTPSPQAGRFLDRLERQKSKLAELGVVGGTSRLAVAPGCTYCGQCLHGCPWGFIWSARNTLSTLRNHPEFEHRTGAVRRFDETPGNVSVTLDTGETLTADRVFVATGVLETARLLMTSGNGALTSMTLKDSQHFFLPSLHRWRAPRRPDQFPFHTLPQAFLEVDDPDISPYLVHAQIYTWNEFFAHDLVSNYGSKLPGTAPFWRALARRLIVAQVFLHSDHSARINLTLASDGRLTPSVAHNAETHPVISSATSRLAKAFGKIGLSTLSFAARAGEPGSGFHVGASLPMSSDPLQGQSDILGRPKGLSRVHVVDASVLPSIPATTITFSVMANAHRIGTLAG
ncbi:GMC oxidoreductase [Ruegeria sp.]|uniref:GMC oxidoreductase n=1 Tax=Ruegeria sp. TaxID=1879320 RepID=UPI003C7BCBEC